jgi:hypothetical protein
MFDPTSRDYNLTVRTETTTDGRFIAYTGRRFLPMATNQTVLAQVMLTEGDRLDNLAANYLGNSLLFWQICDSNQIMNPLSALQPGATIDITLPIMDNDYAG